MAEGRAKFAAIQRSEDGLSIGVRLRVALDLLESLGEAGAALAPRGPKTKLRFDRIEIDEEGQSTVEGTGDQTGVAQLVWEIIAGKPATWSGVATDDDLPDDVPGSVLDLLGGLLGEKGKAGDLGEKLEEASRGFVDTHDDVRSAVASWRESHEEEEAAPVPPPKAPEPAPKAAEPAPKPVAPAPEASGAAPKASGSAQSAPGTETRAAARVEAAPAPAPKPAAPAEPTPVVAAKPVAPAPAAAPKVEPTPPAAKVEAKKPVAVRLPSELPGAWDDAPLSKQLDDVMTEGELPPPESVAPAPPREPEPPLAEGRPGAPAAYPQVPPAPRAPSFPDADEAASIEAKKPGRLAPPHAAVPQPPPASVQRPPQPTVPETKAARSFIETVPPTANLVAPVAAAPAGLLTQPEAAPVAAPPAPPPPAPPPPAPPPTIAEAPAPAAPRAAASPPRAPMKTDPMRTLPKATGPLADLKKTEPMRPRPTSANGAVRAVGEALHEATTDTPKEAAAKPAPPAPPARRTVPDIKQTEPFRRRLPGPHDPGGDDGPARGPLSGPLPADAAALASDGAIPLPVQAPSPAMPTAKVILDGPNKVRGQMETLYTRRPENPTPQPVVQAAPDPVFSIPAPPKKSRLAFIAVVVVALLGIGLFGFLASQMQGPPEMTPAPTVTAPAPSQTVGAAAPQPTPSETAPAPPPATATAVATAEATPTATAAAPTVRGGTSHTAAPHGSGPRTPPKKWQPNLPDRL